jgi:anti-sigma factor RsiW
MQHLDEGIIHGWLDGALTVDEAARVEAHVNECPQCAERVAEARGLIAASSRILMALDSVPNRVVPQSRPVRSRNWAMGRAAAAAIAVVTIGTLVVSKARSSKTESYDTVATTTTNSTRSDAPPSALLAKPSGAAGESPSQSSGKNSEQSNVGSNPRVGATNRRVESITGASANASLNATAKVADGGVAAGVVAGVAEPIASSQPRPVALDMARAAPAPLRIVGSPSVIGEKRTLYEVAPGDTVMLGESENVKVDSVVATGVGTVAAPQAQRKMNVPASTPQRTAPSSFSFTQNGFNTIVWTDVASGKVMRLSGRHSRAELEEIRGRIEQMQAASSGKLKTP